MTFGPPPPLTQDDLVDVLRRNLDEDWIGGLLADPSSLSMFVGMAAVMLRTQAAGDENIDRAGFILTAPGPAPAQSTVRLTRPSGGGVTVAATTRFVDERAMIWRPVGDTPIGASVGPQTVDVPIQTERHGYFLNTFQPLTYQAMDALPGGLAVVPGVDPAAGGTDAMLDLHGAEREIPRAPLEDDDPYRHRMLQLDDTVAPAVLADVILQVLDGSPVGQPIADQIVKDGLRCLRETFEEGALPAQRNLMGTAIAFCDDVFCDDPHGPLMRSAREMTRWLDVALPTPIDPTDSRLFVDDGYCDDPDAGYLDLPLPSAIAQLFATLADELDRRRMGGVGVRIYVGGDQVLIRQPAPASLAQPGDWTAAGAAAPPALDGALETFDADDSYAVSTTGRAAGGAPTAGDLWCSFAALFRAPTTVTVVRLACWARRGTTGGTPPQLAFVFQPTGGANARMVSLGAFPVVIDHADWREYELILEQNPSTTAAWMAADVVGTMLAGVANVAALGVTDELRVSELRLEIVANYG